MRKRLLWVGDAACSTGFSRVTHHVLEVLREEWDVSVLGVNYYGDPHEYPYDIFPASRAGSDLFGFSRLGKVASKLRPDLIVALTDPWHVSRYLKEAGNCPLIASVMVDGENCRGTGLNGSLAAIFCTEFGIEQAKLGGYQGRAAVIPLGVELDIYKPMDRVHARKALGMPPGLHEDAFIVGNVNRNQPRKRLDLTLRYFTRWIREHNRDDAYLYLHVAPTADQGWDINQLAKYYGIASHLIYAEPDVFVGVPESALAAAYATFDCQITTTQGEGFGLTTLEGMACGVPQIVPDWSALGEIVEDAALRVPCTSTAATPQMINAIGGIADEVEFVACLERMYAEPALRDQLRARGIQLAAQECYRWPRIGQQYASIIDQSMNPISRLERVGQTDGESEAARRERDAGETPRDRKAFP
jgi:glycosyltransferase involved in cell wall biosynthesis